MTKDRFTVNPFPDVRVSDLDRQELMNLVDIYVGDYIKKYQDFVVVEKRQVDKRRWDHVKSKGKLNVYAERTRKELSRRGIEPGNSLSATQRVQDTSISKDLPVVMSLGTFVGELDDLMLGVVSPTLDDMRIKDTYLHEVDDAAILCQVVLPSREDPFRSVVIKWMTINMPLQSTNLVKSRDFVFIEATGITYLANGDRVGYQLLHSIEFPQSKPLPNKTRGNLSIFSCFRRKRHDVIENFAWGIVDPGGEIMRPLVIPMAANLLLSGPSYVHCGQMKKLSWLLQRHHSAFDHPEAEAKQKKSCVVCGKKTNHSVRSIGKSSCKICYGSVCYSCKIRQRISYIPLDGLLLSRKVVICARCMLEATHWNAQEAARDRVSSYKVYTSYESRTAYSAIESSMSSYDG